MKHLFVLFACLAVGSLFSGCTPLKDNSSLIPLTVELSWIHTAEFAGLYVAQQEGFYKKAGLDVTFVPANPTASASAAIENVSRGQSEIGLAGLPELMISRANGKNVKIVSALYQQSPNAFVSLKSERITKPVDLNGKIIALSCGSNSEYQEVAFLNKYRIKYKKVCSTYDVSQLTDRQADVVGSFITNEVILWKQRGLEVNTMLPSDYGVDSYPNMIFVNDEYLANHQDVVKRFVEATKQGIQYSLEHEDAALKDTLVYDSQLDSVHQRETLRVQAPLIYNGKNPTGWLDEQKIMSMHDILIQQKFLPNTFDCLDLYTTEFVK